MKRLTRKEKRKLGFKILIALLVLVVLYELYAFASKVYLEYQINLQIEEALQQKDFLIDDNREKQDEILYYDSDDYKEKIAKGSLNMHKPGEIVINIKDEEGNFLGSERDEGETDVEKLPNYRKWWLYFFGT